ncbi:hypothetical protein R1flu_017318 [Riccia fluitans]|uniref:Uncharacterized protein n=1 Tax=Riccia fluitans TaxID=41844 RepID=A0ABD1ZDX7_9MARC
MSVRLAIAGRWWSVGQIPNSENSGMQAYRPAGRQAPEIAGRAPEVAQRRRVFGAGWTGVYSHPRSLETVG